MLRNDAIRSAKFGGFWPKKGAAGEFYQMSDIGSYPQPDAEQVTAVVKWFNPTKGFGFVQPEDGSPDAFLHVSVLEQAGHRDVPDASTIICAIAPGPKGPQVTAVINVTPPEPGLNALEESGDTSVIEGTVKFFDSGKGFGFIIPDEGGQDVFVSARALERSGVQALEPEQRVRMSTRPGQKGPLADCIEVI